MVFTIPPGNFAEEKIRVRLFKIKGGKTARLGIEAPKRITILRDEVAKIRA
jgi:sRNA-binding carbon storage regulator CsrA